MTSLRGNTEVIKYEVRSTKYEVEIWRNSVAQAWWEEAKPKRGEGDKSMLP